MRASRAWLRDKRAGYHALIIPDRYPYDRLPHDCLHIHHVLFLVLLSVLARLEARGTESGPGSGLRLGSGSVGAGGQV